MKPTLKKDEMHLFVHGWPKKLQNRLRAAAANAGRTVKSVLIEAGEQWLTRKKGK